MPGALQGTPIVTIIRLASDGLMSYCYESCGCHYPKLSVSPVAGQSMHMLDHILEIVTGRDDIERMADKGDPVQLRSYLEKRQLWIPARPRRFFEAANCTQEEFREATEPQRQRAQENDVGQCEIADSRMATGASVREALCEMAFEPWVLERDGQKRLPAFSSLAKLEEFSEAMSRQLGKVFPLPTMEALLPEVAAALGVDVVELNLFSERSWEIEVSRAAK